MYAIRWNETYSVGNSMIDSQHQELFRLLEKLLGFYTEDIPGVLQELEEYTHYHFDFEESVLENIGFPDLPDHKAEHVRFKEKLRSLQVELDEGTLSIRMVFTMLSEWLLNHILIVDKRMTPYLNQQTSLQEKERPKEPEYHNKQPQTTNP